MHHDYLYGFTIHRQAHHNSGSSVSYVSDDGTCLCINNHIIYILRLVCDVVVFEYVCVC